MLHMSILSTQAALHAAMQTVGACKLPNISHIYKASIRLVSPHCCCGPYSNTLPWLHILFKLAMCCCCAVLLYCYTTGERPPINATTYQVIFGIARIYMFWYGWHGLALVEEQNL